MSDDDFKTDHLAGQALDIASGIKIWLSAELDRELYGGGCPAFFSPAQWEERTGEPLGDKAILVLCHDGGDLAPCCNVAYEDARSYRALKRLLKTIHVYMESITCVCTVIYPIDDVVEGDNDEDH